MAMKRMTATQILLLSALVCLLYAQEGSGLRILGIFPLNGKSHFIFGEKLFKTLAADGHQVDVVSQFPLKKPFPNYTDLSIADAMPSMVNRLTAEFAMQFRQSSSVGNLLKMTGYEICQLLEHPILKKLIENPPKDPPYDVVIVEVFAFHCYMAFGRHLNVPMIGVAVGNLLPWVAHAVGNSPNPAVSTGSFMPFVHPLSFWERVQNTLLTTFVSLQFNYHVADQDELIHKYFGPNMPIAKDLPKDLSLIFVNTHSSMNGNEVMAPSVIPIGGLHVPEADESALTPELKKWLDESKHGCIYFTFGSMLQIESFPLDKVKAFYEAFEALAPVRVIMKIANESLLPPGLPKNVKIGPWFPQPSVLAHKNTKLFITHGGLMGTWESIAFGIPMVGIPIFGDQPQNVQIYAKKKLAVEVDINNITTSSLKTAINTVLRDPAYKQNAERLAVLIKDRPISAADSVKYWTKYVARHGNVLRSPTLDLTWWQASLLDVYAFLLACVLLVLFVIKMVLKMLLRLFKGTKVDKKKKKQ